MNYRVRTKICGIKDRETALHTVKCGADALGFVAVKNSPRYVEANDAGDIIKQLPAFVTSVALVMDQTESDVRNIIEKMQPNCIQFHGNESAEFCRAFGLPYIKAIPMGGGVDPVKFAAAYSDAQAVLVDSNALGQSGGSGHTLDWTKLPKFSKPVILAGGLTPENMDEAIRVAKPYALDVSSGVESSRGVKDLTKISAFIKGANRVRSE